jgi:hypothetical protein
MGETKRVREGGREAVHALSVLAAGSPEYAVAAARRIPLHFFLHMHSIAFLIEYSVAAARRIAVMQVQIESEEVLGWLQREGGMVDSVRIQNFDHGGETVRGLGATATIAKGKEVLHTHPPTHPPTHPHRHTHTYTGAPHTAQPLHRARR